MRSLIVVTAGLSTPSSTRKLADSLSAATQAAVTSRGEAVEITTVELRDLAAELATAMTNMAAPTPQLNEVKEKLSAADGLIAVTPIFQASYTGLFKMFFDTLDPDSINGMPTIIAATAGSARYSMTLDHALRPLLTFLRAVVVPTGVFQATEDFGSQAGIDNDARIQRAAGELADLMVKTVDYVSGLRGDFPATSSATAATAATSAATDTTQLPHNAQSAATPSHARKRKTGIGVDDDFVPFSQLLD